ncbi:hypothetical protein [Streptomyces sp. NPDC047042]|uniref:hypothetical protein n=1 Tax=Streptomyces sp. NPDC047042 TaxID=3154807 RepID=UPI0033CF38B8
MLDNPVVDLGPDAEGTTLISECLAREAAERFGTVYGPLALMALRFHSPMNESPAERKHAQRMVAFPLMTM